MLILVWRVGVTTFSTLDIAIAVQHDAWLRQDPVPQR
jgi:hypothetical protein